MAEANIVRQLGSTSKSSNSPEQGGAANGFSPLHPPTVTAESLHYERLRTKFFNSRLPTARPAIIATPSTTAEVSRLIVDAKTQGKKVGVRSGGHLFPACSLIDGGLLIDTANLNHTIDYNTVTKFAVFGPATKVREAAETLTALGRFFPFGRHPFVGLCGFMLAGGQGWFMRGWGCTADSWIEQVEIVMPSGQVIVASKNQNQDVFWAMRGSGQGFLGVVTKIWGRTMRAKTVFDRLIMLDATEAYKPQLKWVLQKCDVTPKYGVDIAIVTHYPDLLDAGDHWETETKKLVMMVAITIYADSAEEAAAMTSPWDSIDDDITQNLILQVPCDSILTGEDVSYAEIAELSEKAMCDLPNRKSVGTICVADYYPNEADQALSLPQHHYISTMIRWEDTREDVKYRQWMSDAYKPLERISVGQYVADFDVSQRMSKVMTDHALTKWLLIREKWDPQGMFPGYHGFKSVLDQ